MKDSLRSYLSFSRSQRRGIIILSTLLLILVLVRLSMRYWVSPPLVKDEQELREAWERFKTEQNSLEKETEFPININTADSATLVSLTGIGRKTAHKIMEHRRRGGTIHNFAELEAIQNIPSNASERLKQQIRYSDEDTQKD